MWEWNDYAHLSDEELYHYGVAGMKWGVRKAFYKTFSANHLRRSQEGVKKDIAKLKAKALKKRQRFAKFQTKAANQMSQGNMKKAAKYFKKSSKAMKIANKREKTILHNEKLLKSYEKRLSELDKKAIDNGKNKVDKLLK